MNRVCSICGGNSSKIFDALVLKKHTVDYFQCEECSFIQTDKPFWLKEAYVSAITSIDVGLISRNLHLSNILPPVLDIFSGKEDAYIDYGGGYGMFVRLMRDKGYDFYLHDLYAENLFAKYFELKDYTRKGKFAALTAFEVFEHLEDPIGELDKMFELSDTIIFSTELQQQTSFNHEKDWWYFTPETGQHISFFSKKSLDVLSQKYKCKLFSNKINLHLLTKLDLQSDPLVVRSAHPKTLRQKFVEKIFKKPTGSKVHRISLLDQDFELYKNKARS